MRTWLQDAKEANGGEINDAMIHKHIHILENMVAQLKTFHAIFPPTEQQKIELTVYEQCLEIHMAQLKKGDESQ